MSWIYIDKEKGGEGEMRSQMRRNMRSGSYRTYGMGGSIHSMRGDYGEGYRQGYKHGWEDSEDEDMEYRRARDSRGRFV